MTEKLRLLPMVTPQLSARAIAVVCGIVIVLLLVPFAGRMMVESKPQPREEMILGGPDQPGGIATGITCSYLMDIARPGLYGCDEILVDSRIDRTGSNMRQTLKRIARMDFYTTDIEEVRFTEEENFYRFETRQNNGNPYVVLSYPLEGEFEGLSMYVTLTGHSVENMENRIRRVLTKEEPIHEA